MRTTKLSIRKTRISGDIFWQVVTPKSGGGRLRRTFKDRNEAQSFFDLSKIQLANHGTAAMSISEGLRVEAIECADRLKVFGKGLRDATDFYLAHLRSIENSRSVKDVVAEFMATKDEDESSARYVGDLRARLNRFSETFGEQVVAALTPKQISDWLRGLGVAPLTRNTFRLRLAALFAFARRSGYLLANPIEHVEKAKVREGEIEILTVDQTARLLENASSETLPYWAIGAFAGLRSAEIQRLEWSQVDFDGGYIEVKARNAKTASRRLVPMADNLCAWLQPYRNATGLVCPIGLRMKLESDRERAKLRTEWPQNALRHSFGSYRLPIIQDAAKLSLEMGNSPAMVFAHYREVVKPTVAKKYWEIRPEKASNVVELVA